MELKIGLAKLETQFVVFLICLEEKSLLTQQKVSSKLTEIPVSDVISSLVNLLCRSVKTAIFL